MKSNFLKGYVLKKKEDGNEDQCHIKHTAGSQILNWSTNPTSQTMCRCTELIIGYNKYI